MKTFFIFLAIFMTLTKTYALDKKIQDGSEKIEASKTFLEFADHYMKAFNEKDVSKLVGLMAPESSKCYAESKHPDYYEADFKMLFKSSLKSFKEIRKYTTYDHKFHTLMNFPKKPTHVMVFNAERGWVSADIEERNGKFFLLYRCL